MCWDCRGMSGRSALPSSARRFGPPPAVRWAGTWGRVVAVLDDSFSSSGSTEKRRRPLAVALAANYLLEALAEAYTGLWLAHRGDPLLVHPIGPTPLGDRVPDALQRRPDRLVTVSHGWDNAPPGQAADSPRRQEPPAVPAEAPRARGLSGSVLQRPGGGLGGVGASGLRATPLP